MDDEFTVELNDKAMRLLKDIFPKNISTIDELLNSEVLKIKNCNAQDTDQIGIACPRAFEDDDNTCTLHCDNSMHAACCAMSENAHNDMVSKIPAALPASGMVHSNRHILGLIQCVQPLMDDLIDHVGTIKLWIHHLAPSIEEGDNFGVEVQEQTIDEVDGVETRSLMWRDEVSRYFTLRGEAVADVMKNPYIEDFRLNVQEVDMLQSMLLRRIVRHMRDDYITLLDVISKNEESITQPR